MLVLLKAEIRSSIFLRCLLFKLIIGYAESTDFRERLKGRNKNVVGIFA